MTKTCCVANKVKTTHFSLKISFSCSVQTFMNCRALYTFIGSSIRPFMLINFTRRCSESYIMGGMTDSCLICFSLFCETWTEKVDRVTPIGNILLVQETIFLPMDICTIYFEIITVMLQISKTRVGDADQTILFVSICKCTNMHNASAVLQVIFT